MLLPFSYLKFNVAMLQRKLTVMSDIFELLRRNVSEVDSLNRVSHAGKSPSGECCFKRKILEILLKRLLKTSGI